MLINPIERLIIRKNPIYREPVIACDELNPDLTTKRQKGSFEGNIYQAFAYFCNEGIIKPKGWVEVRHPELKDAFEQAKQKLKKGDLYYGSVL